ncbi:hypothetical protein QUF76_16690 [Desulfobacterales bacterium HSG16]|nr:hypothetical protein [Desulfobacterales bacterium HSG16]
MSVKLNHYYSIIPGKNEEYDKFIINDFIPGLKELGLDTAAGWTVLIGAYSEIVFESVAGDLESLEKALCHKKYRALNASLLNHVNFYKTKVLVNTEKMDHYTTDFCENCAKYNQTWEVIGDKKEAYDKFSSEEFYPCMNELGITVAGEWEVLIGDGPHIICEGRVDDVKKMISSLQNSKFQKAKRKLRGYVENYQSRILSFHIKKRDLDTYELMLK